MTLKNVVRVVADTVTTEKLVKTKEHGPTNYGAHSIEETILRVTSTKQVALLSCGHWRANYGSGADVRAAKRLACYVCDTAERVAAIIAKGGVAPEWMNDKPVWPNDGSMDRHLPPHTDSNSRSK